MSIEIDRLVIDIPGLSPDQGRDLARRIGAALAEGEAFEAGAALERLDLTVALGADLDVMAARVAAGIRGALG